MTIQLSHGDLDWSALEGREGKGGELDFDLIGYRAKLEEL